MRSKLYMGPMSREETDKWNQIRRRNCLVCGKPMLEGKLKLTAQGFIHKSCGRAK